MKEKISLLAEKIAASKKFVIFTGAGISTESGIPDYRSKGGLWNKFHPVYFDEFMSSKKSRIEFWRQKTELYPDLVKAAPNAGHAAIYKFHEMGLLQAVITQNIDGLHQASGLPDEKVIELHGNTRRVRCMSCGALFPDDEINERIVSGDLAPECECGGYLKSDTVSFGQQMPAAEMERASGLSKSCDVFLVIGSTLLVHPAAFMPNFAKEAGAFLGIINLSSTSYDGQFDVLIRGKAGEVLSGVVEAVMANL